MSAEMPTPAGEMRGPSWNCVHFTPKAPGLDELAIVGVEAFEIDADATGDEASLLAALGEAFSFPSYFGGNWDAAEECLRDLGWLDGDDYALTVRGARDLWTGRPELAGRLVRSWLFCAGHWSREGAGFHLVFEW